MSVFKHRLEDRMSFAFPKPFRVSGRLSAGREIAVAGLFCLGLSACQSVSTENVIDVAGKTGVDEITTGSVQPIALLMPPGGSSQLELIRGPFIFETVPLKFRGSRQIKERMAVLAEEDGGILARDCERSDACSERMLVSMRRLVDDRLGYDPLQQLERVNRLINASITYRSEGGSGASRDHWQSFAETVKEKSGDCEDFVIAKHALLRRMGFSPDDLYVSVLKDTARDLHHAVLVVRLGENFFVLDNLTDRVRTDEVYPQYRPLYTFTERSVWLHGDDTRPAIKDLPMVL